ncbi:MAG: TonB-dependent receptor [Pseudomonadales bacterium]
MTSSILRRAAAAACLGALACLAATFSVAATPATAGQPGAAGTLSATQTSGGLVEEVIVSGDASLAARLGATGSMDMLSGEELTGIGATHVNEALARIPGVWITRGSGQEHLTAIRSPVYSGTGACGEFLYLEDGVPIRPAGFCNINNLFEVNTEQAAAIEVWRGPASAVLGGNALHGAVNVITAVPEDTRFTLEAGPYDFYRVGAVAAVDLGSQQLGVAAQSVSTNGWRDATGYDQQKLSLVQQTRIGAWEVRNTLNYSLLNQETGGYVYGYKAYKDSRLRDTNPNPEAYRDAWSLRAASHWRNGPWRLVPYVRRSDMRFLQHFLPGQPLEENDQTSGGLMLGYDLEQGRLRTSFGSQIELMQGSLYEYQALPLTDSSAFNNAVRPQGAHYDYDVDSLLLAAYYDLNWDFADKLSLVHSLRVERIEYDYDNRMLDGNSRDDGTTCGFGGCLYNRPADREDDFSNVAGRLGIERALRDAAVYLVFGTGFRPPQATELYRLQRGQDIAELDSERVLSAEMGYRSPHLKLAAFAERTEHFIFRDAAGLNVSDGKTKSIGVELSYQRTLGANTFELAASYAEHRYDFNGGATGGEVIVKNNMVDTAPRWLGNARWRYAPSAAWDSEFELNFVGEHYIDALNSAEYDGHYVVNWRGRYRLSERTELFARVINVLDERYADRADYTIFDADRYRYFPAMPRQIYAGVTFTL